VQRNLELTWEAPTHSNGLQRDDECGWPGQLNGGVKATTACMQQSLLHYSSANCSGEQSRAAPQVHSPLSLLDHAAAVTLLVLRDRLLLLLLNRPLLTC
jgi:hypothetical protein